MNSENVKKVEFICSSQKETFQLGEKFGETLSGGEIVLLFGGLGAGKTLLTKGILNTLDYDIDEVTSPSFTLVNRYDAKFTVYHIDLWRIENNAEFAVGLHEILEEEKSIVIIEWSERLTTLDFGRKTLRIEITGDGDDQRTIKISNETDY
jgi:tRNA threonylcarbamoyladenosine biosynthesis protein TsaE